MFSFNERFIFLYFVKCSSFYVVIIWVQNYYTFNQFTLTICQLGQQMYTLCLHSPRAVFFRFNLYYNFFYFNIMKFDR